MGVGGGGDTNNLVSGHPITQVQLAVTLFLMFSQVTLLLMFSQSVSGHPITHVQSSHPITHVQSISQVQSLPSVLLACHPPPTPFPPHLLLACPSHPLPSSPHPPPIVPQGDWLKLGFILSIFYLSVWLGIGGAWWKVIGLW